MYICPEKQSELAKTYDSGYIDEVIIDNPAVLNQNSVLKAIMSSINKKYNVELLVNLRCLPLGHCKYSKAHYYLSKNIKAKEKITSVIDFTDGYKEFQLLPFDTVYKTKTPDLFEIEHRRKFFEKAFDVSIPENIKTDLPILVNLNKFYITISLFATTNTRMYSFENWKIIINKILDLYKCDENFELIFLGSKKESILIDEFIYGLNNPQVCKNLAGRISLGVVPEILRNSKLLLSVETGTVHIAKAVGCPVICISNGMYWGHYQPYPDGSVEYIYPQKFISLLKQADLQTLKELYIFNNSIDINSIDPYSVINLLENTLKIN